MPPVSDYDSLDKIDINIRALVNVSNALNGNVIEILNNLLHGKRDVVDANAPVGVSNVANYNVVDILNNVGSKRMTRRSLIAANVPVSVTDAVNGNVIAVTNHVL